MHTAVIGNTPLVHLESISASTGCEIYGKAEYLNPTGSVKDRCALGILQDAEINGTIQPGDTLVELTAGNTGISLAQLGSERGYKVVTVLPDRISQDKIDMARSYGAAVELVPSERMSGRQGFEEVIQEVQTRHPGSYWTDQFNNLANYRIHHESTGPEIYAQLPQLDAFVCAIGTGGTFSGIAVYLKEQRDEIRVFAADPMASSIYGYVQSCGRIVEKHGSTIVEGTGPAYITENVKQGLHLAEQVIQVTDAEALNMLYRLMDEEGLFLGPSAALNVVAAIKVAKIVGSGCKIVTILCDKGERYASRVLSEAWLRQAGLYVAVDTKYHKYLKA